MRLFGISSNCVNQVGLEYISMGLIAGMFTFVFALLLMKEAAQLATHLAGRQPPINRHAGGESGNRRCFSNMSSERRATKGELRRTLRGPATKETSPPTRSRRRPRSPRTLTTGPSRPWSGDLLHRGGHGGDDPRIEHRGHDVVRRELRCP